MTCTLNQHSKEIQKYEPISVKNKCKHIYLFQILLAST